MKNYINPEIMSKINEIDDENLKEFLENALDLEYSVQDRDKPRVTKDYRKLINKYYED